MDLNHKIYFGYFVMCFEKTRFRLSLVIGFENNNYFTCFKNRICQYKYLFDIKHFKVRILFF